MASCPPGDAVFAPFCDASNAMIAALNLNRRAIGNEINARYKAMAKTRLSEKRQKTRTRVCSARHAYARPIASLRILSALLRFRLS